MTNVASTQAPEALLSVDIDPIDLLVPPPRGIRRSLPLTAIAVLVVVIVVAMCNAGLVRPKLGLTPDASYTAAGSSTKPSLAFDIRNDGSFPFTLSGVDASASGLSDARVTIEPVGAGGELRTSYGFPLRMSKGDIAHITVSFAAWNCPTIELHGRTTIPIHLAGPLGVNTTVSVVPGFRFDPPDAGVLIGSPDQTRSDGPPALHGPGVTLAAALRTQRRRSGRGQPTLEALSEDWNTSSSCPSWLEWPAVCAAEATNIPARPSTRAGPMLLLAGSLVSYLAVSGR